MDSNLEVIDRRLERLADMFEVPPTDPFSESYRSETGVDHCMGQLLVRTSRAPVRLEVQLPATEVDDGTAERLRRAMGR